MNSTDQSTPTPDAISGIFKPIAPYHVEDIPPIALGSIPVVASTCKPSDLYTLWSNPQRVNSNDISFITTKELYGWMHCMSAYAVDWEGIRFPTAEHLFQWLRFSEYPNVQDKVLAAKSPMASKWVARDHKGLLRRTAWDEGADDIRNMRRVLRHKLADHPSLAQMLKATGQAVLIEDCTYRDRDSARYWGAVKIGDKWHGENVLGCLWMEQRDLL